MTEICYCLCHRSLHSQTCLICRCFEKTAKIMYTTTPTESVNILEEKFKNLDFSNSDLLKRLEKLEGNMNIDAKINDAISYDFKRRLEKIESTIAEKSKNTSDIIRLQNDWSLKVDERLDNIEFRLKNIETHKNIYINEHERLQKRIEELESRILNSARIITG